MSEPFHTNPGETEVHLRVTTSDIAPEVVLCAVAGEVDLATGPQLADTFGEVLERGPCHLVIDLSDVRFLGSTGLKILVDVNSRQQERHRRLALVVAHNRAAERPLQATGLNEVLDVHHELTTAVQTCRPVRHGDLSR